MKNEFEKLFDSLEDLKEKIEYLEKGIQSLEKRQESIDKGLMRLGKSPASKSTLSDEAIVQLYGEGVSVKEIAEKASLGIHGVYAVLRKYK